MGADLVNASSRDIGLASELAMKAVTALLDLRRNSTLTAAALGEAGDRIANRIIVDALAAARPDDGLLSEESVDDLARLQKRRVWIVDPLDGTREYREGRTDWAVHVALAIDNIAACGAVALPAQDYIADSGVTMPPEPPGFPLRMVVSRSRPVPIATAVAERLGATLLTMGSAGAKAMAVARGNADVYLHAGGQYEWDSCAPVAVASALGLHCSRIDGSPLRYNCRDVYLPDLLICSQEAAAFVLSSVAEIASSS